MSEAPGTPEATPAAAPAPVATPAAAPETFSREYVEELRRENASHRTGKTAAVEAAVAELNTTHQAALAARDTALAEVQNQLGSAWIELEKLHTSLAAKVPSDKVLAFTEILKGEDKESITESVKSSLQLFGGFDSKSPAFDPSQGLGGKGNIPLNGDPILAALKAAVGVK